VSAAVAAGHDTEAADDREREARAVGERAGRASVAPPAHAARSPALTAPASSHAGPATAARAGGREPHQQAGARVRGAPAGVHPRPSRWRAQRTRGPPGLTGEGTPLHDRDRERLEPLLGLDLSAVRVHSGPPAEALAREHRAHAFAYGSHVVLGRNARRASRHARTQVLAHELAHVRQQVATPAPDRDTRFDNAPRGPPAHGSWPSAARAPPAHEPGHTLARAPLGVQRLPDDDDSILPAWVSSAAGAVAEAGSFVISPVVEAGGEVVEFAAEQATALIDRLAPGLLDFLRGGGLRQITELFCTGIDALLGRLFGALGEVDFMSAIETTFTQLADGVRSVQAAIGGAARSAVGTLLGPLVRALQEWGGPIVETIQSISNTINGLFTGLWDNVAVPVLNFLETVGGAVWRTFTGLVTWIWDLTAPLRDAAETAWNWLLEQFDLAWDSTSGVREWLAGLAADAWATFLETIEPIREPLMVAAGVLVLLSPLGPIVVLTQVVPPLWEKIVWLWNNWNTEDILVRAQEVLREDILPGIIGLVSSVASAMAGAASWLAGVVASFGTAMSSVLGVFGANGCLRAVTTYLQGIADQFNRLAAWAQSGFSGLREALVAVFDALVAIFQPILDFLVRLLIVVTNPFLIPVALTAAVWLLCPDDLKPPVINFVLDQLIAAISGFPAFLSGLWPLASVIKAGVLGFLRHLRSGDVGDELRVAASNKIANIAAGGGIEFISGFALGLLHGLIDGIIDPFRLIFLLAKAIGLAIAAIGRAVAPFVLAHVPGLAPAVAGARESVATAIGPTPAAAPAAGPAAGTPPAPAPSAATEAIGSRPAEGSISARGPPAAAAAPVELELAPAPGDVTDAEIVAAMSPGAIADLRAGAAEPGLDEVALETEMRAEVETEGATVGGLARLLGGAWDAIIAGAENVGARAAAALLEFIMQPDFQLGRKIGFVAGFVLLQALIIYFTAGGYAALKPLEPAVRQLVMWLLRFLDLGGELFAVLGRALRPLRGPIVAGLGAARGFLSRFRFARGLNERIERLAARVFGFGDEAARAAREAGEHAPGRAAAEAGERAPGRLPGEAPPPRGVSEGAPVRAADDLGPGGLRAADEPAVPTIRDDTARAAQEAAVLVEARGIAEANDAIGSPVAVVLVQLMVLKRRHRWIDTFTARMVSPGTYRLEMVASPGVPVDTHYTPDALTIDDVRSRLPGVPIDARSPLRLQAIEALNRLPPGQRDEILAALARMDPDEAGRALTALGRLDPAEVVARARAAELREAGFDAPQPAVGEALPEGTQAVGPRPRQPTAEASAADVLAANLRRELGSRPPGHAAHHVVPKGMAGAQEARDILARADIDVNDAANGMWLPEDYTVVNELTGEIHSTIHTGRYVRWLTELLREAEREGGPEAVRRALRDIRALVASAHVVR
jgi:hypothetical protein